MVAENPLKNMLSRTRGRSAPPLRSLKDASLEHNSFFISIPSDTALSYFCGQRDSTVFYTHFAIHQVNALRRSGARHCLATALSAKGPVAMTIVSIFVLFALWTGIASANNKTIIHGWVPEPHGRGTWSIVWSCLVTIFICTWSVLHLDVPKRHGWWYLFYRKVGWMLLAALAPEYNLFMAVDNFFQARVLLGYLVTHGGDEWTLVHAEFAVAGGIRVKSPESDEIMPKRIESLRKAVESGQINEPTISEDKLRSRSKSDGVVKLIALLQITWFGLQALFRAIQHLQVTALEIMTVAFFVMAVLIYAFRWNRPQDIEYPIIIKLQNAETRVEASQGLNVDTKSRGGTKAWFTDEKYEAWLDWDIVIIPVLIAPLFGAIHCLAWNGPFPTAREALAWRICAVVTTSLPLLEIAIFFVGVSDVVSGTRYNDSTLEGWIICTPIVLYAIARITLITLAFMSLRALPADAFQTIAWTNYIPNLGV